ncbi:hypothetical protein IMZ31_23215 (plasmid) [Pontibacillus sp. ALD_SL1]|uniref:hypothetical protein n=1 Tax=Pontibacillus sp. ALD_SL1 TaxID=2777185 RepID=UPI001A97053D|nr:hypothetical protein [Pontibacillus sp. ALD_SL1]QST02363.1 hypothetical protein IMZ31_23215 [Pontibacillus sp. ALD_SL1]
MGDANLEELYTEFEELKAESKEKQLRAKEIKDEIMNQMEEDGVDEVIIEGLDGLVELSITYPEREVLNKKALAQALDMKQKELSKPQVIIQLTNEGRLTEEMIEQFTEIEERKQFSAKEYTESEEE